MTTEPAVKDKDPLLVPERPRYFLDFVVEVKPINFVHVTISTNFVINKTNYITRGKAQGSQAAVGIYWQNTFMRSA